MLEVVNSGSRKNESIFVEGQDVKGTQMRVGMSAPKTMPASILCPLSPSRYPVVIMEIIRKWMAEAGMRRRHPSRGLPVTAFHKQCWLHFIDSEQAEAWATEDV